MKTMITKLALSWIAGGWAGKLKITLLGALLITPFAEFFEKYIFSAWQFAVYLSILVVIDTILGIWKAIKLGNVSSRGIAKFFEKVIIYFLFLIVLHVISNFETGLADDIMTWFSRFGHSAMVVRELVSIVEKIGAIRPGSIPRWLLAKLLHFDNTGKFKKDDDVSGMDTTSAGGNNGAGESTDTSTVGE